MHETGLHGHFGRQNVSFSVTEALDRDKSIRPESSEKCARQEARKLFSSRSPVARQPFRQRDNSSGAPKVRPTSGRILKGYCAWADWPMDCFNSHRVIPQPESPCRGGPSCVQRAHNLRGS
jgi:hypothetical protein